MKNIIFILTLFFSLTLFAQQKSFEITNKLNGTVKTIAQNERVKLRTLDGKKHIGELHFTSAGEIEINNKIITIDSVKSIKKHPKTLSTVKTVVLYTGLAVLGSALVVAASGGNAAFLLFTTGSGVCIAAGVLEALNSNSTIVRNDFKIIEN